MRYLLVIAVICFIYLPWFQFSKTLSSGDWPYLFPENIKEFKIITEPPFIWLESYYQITAKLGVQVLSLSWEATERIFWFIPLIFLNLFSSLLFIKFILKELKITSLFVVIGSLVYTTNTYFLMLVGGGQMGVALAYGFVPLVIYFLIRILKESQNLKLIVLAVLVSAAQLMFDPRIYLLTLFAFLVYSLFYFYFYRNVKFGKFVRIGGIVFISICLNLFWIAPNIFFYQQEYSLIATEPLASFLSFASFSNSISLLHPNWPENIFGKIGFMKPEFIFIGLLPYLSLIFINLKEKKQAFVILFFSFLGLLGAFLAKGVNPPIGEIYQIFSNIPGSSLFRDPTKFYILTAISYSILIPLSLYFISAFLNKRLKNLGKIFILIFIVYFLVLLKPALLGQLSGTFSPHEVPSDYIKFKNYILAQNAEFNTLWLPSAQRYGFSSMQNKAIAESDLFLVEDISSSSALLNNNKAKEQLRSLNIRYVVVPYDSLKEIFVYDRKFNDSLYVKTINELKNIRWLSLLIDEKGNSKFGKIAVFKVTY